MHLPVPSAEGCGGVGVPLASTLRPRPCPLLRTRTRRPSGVESDARGPTRRESCGQESNPGLLAGGRVHLPTPVHHLWAQMRKGQLCGRFPTTSQPLPPSVTSLQKRKYRLREVVEPAVVAQLARALGLFETWCLLGWFLRTLVNPSSPPRTLSIHLVSLSLAPAVCQAPGMSDEPVVAPPLRVPRPWQPQTGRLGAPAAWWVLTESV